MPTCAVAAGQKTGVIIHMAGPVACKQKDYSTSIIEHNQIIDKIMVFVLYRVCVSTDYGGVQWT